ncbi:hypothetical protein T265_11474 [Opisthorchis viverrini]|uniref:Uncharacterized protein n=1 Tax=Opisthorchis viverrini TaxID=6198 RepID=A0A074YYG9_OPIVI|nr:hypothetical protein T265_11474 [Opisthorchis viverrini]KER19846.1 hypothetical protein T265_11474 [Opisthorchis viverrini]
MKPADRTTSRDQSSAQAGSTYINTHATLLITPPPTHRSTHLRLGSSSRRIWRLTNSSKETSGTNSAGRGPVALRMAIQLSIENPFGGPSYHATERRVGILPGCPNLVRGSRETEVGFEPRTFRSVNSRSNHLSPSYDQERPDPCGILWPKCDLNAS